MKKCKIIHDHFGKATRASVNLTKARVERQRAKVSQNNIYLTSSPLIVLDVRGRRRRRGGTAGGGAQEARVLDLAHLVDGRSDGGRDHRGLGLGTAQQRRDRLLRGGLISDFALGSVRRVLEARPDLAQVQGRYVAVAFVVPLRSPTPGTKACD